MTALQQPACQLETSGNIRVGPSSCGKKIPTLGTDVSSMPYGASARGVGEPVRARLLQTRWRTQSFAARRNLRAREEESHVTALVSKRFSGRSFPVCVLLWLRLRSKDQQYGRRGDVRVSGRDLDTPTG